MEKLNNEDRRQWITNDEGLYTWYRGSRTTMPRFIRENRAELDRYIHARLSWRPSRMDVDHLGEIQYYHFSQEHRLDIRFREARIDTETACCLKIWEDVLSGPLELAVVDLSWTFLLLLRFGNQPWWNTSYSQHLTPRSERLVVPTSRLQVTLVGSGDQLLASRRLLLDESLAKCLYHLAETQLQESWFDRASYLACLNLVYGAYPQPEQLLQHPGLVTRVTLANVTV